MRQTVHSILSVQSRLRIALLTLVLMAAIGVIDHVTGYELALSILYLIPVGLATWYAGKRLGLVTCVLSAVVWFAVDRASGHQYTLAAIPFWNASVRLGFFLVTAHLLGRLHSALKLHAELALRDGLTGIANSRALRQRWSALAQGAGRHGHPMTLAYLDLDGFKAINDTLGHGGGDRVLQAVASALAAGVRASDSVARLGGDEFAILLPNTDLAGATACLGPLRERLSELAERNGWALGFSLGVAVFANPPADAEEAIRHADDLMYAVKAAGKNNTLCGEFPAHDTAGAVAPGSRGDAASRLTSRPTSREKPAWQ